MQCPRCRDALATGRVGDLTVLGCPHCAGLWLDNADSQRVVNGLRDSTIAALRERSTSGAAVDTGADLRCPHCSATLERKRVERAWLEVDICAEHGTWFDAGEVERVALALQRPDANDWRAVLAGPAPAPLVLSDDLPERDHRSPYVKGFANILRSLWSTLTDTEQYTTEADIDIEVAGRRYTIKLESADADAGFS